MEEIIQKAFPSLRLEKPQREDLATYLALLVQWNQVYNLTSIRHESGLIYKHILDGLVPLGLSDQLPALLQGEGLDLGSGAGVPGLVLSLACPQLKILSVDAVEKKITFQKIVAARTARQNFTALHQRFEQLAQNPRWQKSFDFVCARALTSLDLLFSWSRLFLRPGGWLWAWKGQSWQAEWGQTEAPDFRLAASVEYQFGQGYGGVLCLFQHQP